MKKITAPANGFQNTSGVPFKTERNIPQHIRNVEIDIKILTRLFILYTSTSD